MADVDRRAARRFGFGVALVGGWIAGEIGLRLTIVAAACVGLLGALWLALSPLRSVKQLP